MDLSTPKGIKTRVLYDGRHYVACGEYGDYLTVQVKIPNKQWRGIAIPADLAYGFVEALDTAIDDKERHDICSALWLGRDCRH